MFVFTYAYIVYMYMLTSGNTSLSSVLSTLFFFFFEQAMLKLTGSIQAKFSLLGVRRTPSCVWG